jgi:hypothetical protein
MANLTEQQKTAITEQSANMSVDEKKVFRDKIQEAQKKDTAINEKASVNAAPELNQVIQPKPLNIDTSINNVETLAV